MLRALARRLRRWWWARRRVWTIGDLSIGWHCQFLTGTDGRIYIGARVSLADQVVLNACHDGQIAIGDDCLIGPRVYIRTANHRTTQTDVPIRVQGHERGVVIIGRDVWLGAGVIVLPDVHIGESCVIGAGSVVTQSLPDGVVAAGNPCRVIRVRP